MKKFIIYALLCFGLAINANAQCPNPLMPPNCTPPLVTHYSSNQHSDPTQSPTCYFYLSYDLIECPNFVLGAYITNLEVYGVGGCIPNPAIVKQQLQNMNATILSNSPATFDIPSKCYKYITVDIPASQVAALMASNPTGGMCFPNWSAGNQLRMAILVPCDNNICCNFDQSTNPVTITSTPACGNTISYPQNTSFTFNFPISGGTFPLSGTIFQDDVSPCMAWCELEGIPTGVAGWKMARVVNNLTNPSTNTQDFEFIIKDRKLDLTHSQDQLMGIFLYDIQGKPVKVVKENIPQYVDVSDLKSNIYIFRALMKDGTVVKSKLSLQF